MKSILINACKSIFVIYALVCLALFALQESMIFFPQKINQTFSFSFDNSFEEVFIEINEDEHIHALHFTLENPKGVILYFHGNGETVKNAGADAENFLKYNYEVLVPDYRSYGKSQGKLSQKNLFDDAQKFYDHLLAKGWKRNEIVIYGRSLGTGVASHLAAAVQPNTLILVSPFLSMETLASENYPFVPISLLLRYPLLSEKYLASANSNIFIFHGTNDSIVPYKHGEHLAAQTKARLITLKGGEHNNLGSFDLFWNEMELALLQNNR